MFPVSSKVHSKEGEGKEGEGDKGLSNEGKRDPCDELPEVVGAGDNWETVEPRNLTVEIVISLSEDSQMLMTEKIHELCKTEDCG